MHDARQEYPVAARLRYEAILDGREYRIAEGGRPVKVEYDALSALNFLHMDCFAQAYAALPPETKHRIAGLRVCPGLPRAR